QQAKGLMFRRELPEGQGMLFDFGHEQPTSFWMKNTYIPLDMIFIRGDGRIAKIAENTVPLSEALISSGSPVRAVLEVIGGTAKKLGIAPGDRVAHAIFAGASGAFGFRGDPESWDANVRWSRFPLSRGRPSATVGLLGKTEPCID